MSTVCGLKVLARDVLHLLDLQLIDAVAMKVFEKGQLLHGVQMAKLTTPVGCLETLCIAAGVHVPTHLYSLTQGAMQGIALVCGISFVFIIVLSQWLLLSFSYPTGCLYHSRIPGSRHKITRERRAQQR